MRSQAARRYLVLSLLLALCVAAIPFRASAQEPLPDRNPLETAWYLGERTVREWPVEPKLTPEGAVIPNEEDYRSDVARDYWQLERPEQALAVMRRLSAGEQTTLARDLLPPFQTISDDSARKLLQQAVVSVKDRKELGFFHFLIDAVGWSIKLGQSEQARSVAESFDDQAYEKSEALAQVAQQLIIDKQNAQAEAMLDRAFKLAQAAPEDYDKLQIGKHLDEIAAGYFALGKTEKLAALLELAERYSSRGGGQYGRFGPHTDEATVRQLIRTLIRGRQFDQAANVLAEMRWNSNYDLIGIAESFAANGSVKHAVKVL